jgi:hypothetical protein
MPINLVQHRSGPSVWERGRATEQWDVERWLAAVLAGGYSGQPSTAVDWRLAAGAGARSHGGPHHRRIRAGIAADSFAPSFRNGTQATVWWAKRRKNLSRRVTRPPGPRRPATPDREAARFTVALMAVMLAYQVWMALKALSSKKIGA